MFRFRFGSTRSPKLNPSSPSSRGGVAILPRPCFQAPQSRRKTLGIWGQNRDPRGCLAPSKPAAGFAHSTLTDPTPFARGSHPCWLQTSHLRGLPRLDLRMSLRRSPWPPARVFARRFPTQGHQATMEGDRMITILRELNPSKRGI